MNGATLAAYVDSWREAHAVSQNELMERAKLSGTFLTGLRRGADVQLSSLEKLAEAMGMDLIQLLAAARGEEIGVAAGATSSVDVIAAVDADPNLLPEAKKHLVNQYGLLLRIQGDAARAASDHQPTARRRGSHGKQESGTSG